MRLNSFYIDDIIKTALLEDINYIDTTTDYLIPVNQTSKAVMRAKASGVLCGAEIAARVFELLDSDISVDILKHDGHFLENGDIIMEISGKTRTLLKGERTALNLIQHMSGIATLTNECVKRVAKTSASIADTRKTLPGLRALQKYAVTVGGGKNHRFNLSDAAMLKDNHVDAGGGITNAVEALRKHLGHMVKIEVEVRNLEELKEALSAKVDVIMLDNMDLNTMAEAVKITSGKAILEASGGITLDSIEAVAKTGVDIISVGALTHSVKAFDISMNII
ncbi:MAG: carboxylating nicotinate-nucleotide diphosphorylase [Bacillota bacterium]|nr:carboxylating nicotinate-nucleotide diphosphorylase [Bacillota bacterium]